MAKKTVNQEMKIKTRKISDLIRAEYNPRELTKEQQNQLTDSLKRFGLVDPIIVNTHKDRKNILVGGHQRMKVWESMGNETIPTVEVSLNLEKEKELNIRLNKNTGKFDTELLLEHFDTDDLIEWGFDDYEFPTFEEELDYSILDDEDLESELDEMTSGVKKAIQIEFDLEHYEEASELVRYWREQEAYIGAMIIEKLKDEKNKSK
jgi:hypothetical protein